jgi:hypothetical protein
VASNAAEKMVCRHCHAVLDGGDRFCRQCGAATTDAIVLPGEPVAESPSRRGQRRPRSESAWGVLVMLFLTLGPLALPMLWRSRHFSRSWKIVLTILVGVITALIVAILWEYIPRFLAEMEELHQALSP